ncbi:hypothetical protein M427DRAFT_29421 [Gonapodya prolifera JEL478]|uniref:Uncharacterized protein n=1 Tax=Gonapodya prolifera (strain JEL478) TaxID=1344416 RepID=A0A139AQI6_GONPJ|nr:hypothetical protein M427DRAFT_29421 [Gonapodya prolifera JEL478]|eukprot:KXS18988.1 hypothetical protein M427DRAFT_29421 [Gonapodya prolifera JEL478]
MQSGNSSAHHVPTVSTFITFRRRGPLFLLFLFILSALPPPTLCETRYKWAVSVSEYVSPPYTQARITQLTPAVLMVANTSYLLTVRIIDAQSGVDCQECTLEYAAVGGRPIVNVLDGEAIDSINSDWPLELYHNTSVWLFPLKTSTYPSVSLLSVTRNGVATPRLVKGRLDRAQFRLGVTAALRRSVSSASASAVQYASLLGTLADPSTLTTNPTPLSTLRILTLAVPDLSPSTFMVLSDSPGPYVLVSNDGWRNALAIRFNPGADAGAGAGAAPAAAVTAMMMSNPCGGAAQTTLRVLGAFNTGPVVVVHTDGGVFAIFDGGLAGATVVPILRSCVAQLYPTTQRPSYNASSSCSPLIIAGGGLDAGRLWASFDSAQGLASASVSSSYTAVEEILDARNRTLAAWLVDQGAITTGTGVDVVGAVGSSAQCGDVDVLVRRVGDGLYQVAKASKDMDSGKWTWSRGFVFPRLVRAANPSDLDPASYRVYDSTAPPAGVATMTLELDGIALQGSLGSDLWVWGTSLLWSPDFGMSWFILSSLSAPERFTHVATSSLLTGSFAASTTLGRLFYGQTHHRTLVALAPIGPVSTSVHEFPLFDVGDSLGVVRVEVQNGGGLSISRRYVDVQEVLDWVGMLQGWKCPYKDMVWDAPKDEWFTRLPNEFNDTSVFPSSIFLEEHESYSLRVLLIPSDGVSPEDLRLTVVQSDVEMVGTEVRRDIDTSDGSVTFTITATDQGARTNQDIPGASLHPTTVMVVLDDANFACKDMPSTDVMTQSAASHSFLVYSGCKPFQEIRFVPTNDLFVWCPNTHGLPCIHYEKSFSPLFAVYDYVTGDETNFTGYYRLNVVGGGETYESIKEYTSYQVEHVNPRLSSDASTTLMWVPTHGGLSDPDVFTLEGGMNAIS